MLPSPRVALCAAVSLLLALPAVGESALRLHEPEELGDIAASTYDERGLRVGEAKMSIRRLDNGNIELRSQSGISGSARATLRAELEPVAGGTLRPVLQVTEARDEEGRSLGRTVIDHHVGSGTCGVADGSTARPAKLELPPRDRVANVPLNLLFHPLLTGEQERVDFQVLLCRSGARLVDARAQVVGRDSNGGEGLVEVRYQLDLGPVLSRLAAPFLPRLSLWFDSAVPGAWVGHRMPLFSGGPTVVVVRQGFTKSVLVADP
jgi:hypothetical protein